MAQIFAGDGKQFAAFLPVHCGFGGLHVMRGAGLDLDEAQNLVVPAIRSISPRRLGERKLRATMVYPCLRR